MKDDLIQTLNHIRDACLYIVCHVDSNSMISQEAALLNIRDLAKAGVMLIAQDKEIARLEKQCNQQK